VGNTRLIGPAFAVLVALLAPEPAAAQALGTFRWQLQPFCNVVTLNVTQQGAVYTLDGTDDQCGGGRQAAARGMAFVNLNGTIGFGFTVVTAPGGVPLHVDATIALANLSGAWVDTAGNAGPLVFVGAGGLPGNPRPAPLPGGAPNAVTAVQIAPGAVGPQQLAAGAVTAAAIASGTITTAALAAPPQLVAAPPAADVVLTVPVQTVRTVALTAPSAGRVLVTASGNFQLGGSGASAQCSLSTGGGIEPAYRIEGQKVVAGTFFVPFSGSRVLDVGPGPVTVNLNCTSFSGDAAIYSVQVWALFVPS
jgi:hypothetical protein